MKFAMLAALALATTGVALVATADEAAACIPPNCPGFGRCYVDEETVGVVEDPVTGSSYDLTKPTIRCYY